MGSIPGLNIIQHKEYSSVMEYVLYALAILIPLGFCFFLYRRWKISKLVLEYDRCNTGKAAGYSGTNHPDDVPEFFRG